MSAGCWLWEARCRVQGAGGFVLSSECWVRQAFEICVLLVECGLWRQDPRCQIQHTGCWKLEAGAGCCLGGWVRKAAQCQAVSDTYRLQQAAFRDGAVVHSVLGECLGMPGVARECPSSGSAIWQQYGGCVVWGTFTSPCTLSHSLCRTSMRICSLTVLGHCQPPAPRPGGQGTVKRSVSPRGVTLPVALSGAAPCPPLCPLTGHKGEPAPCPETH